MHWRKAAGGGTSGKWSYLPLSTLLHKMQALPDDLLTASSAIALTVWEYSAVHALLKYDEYVRTCMRRAFFRSSQPAIQFGGRLRLS